MTALELAERMDVTELGLWMTEDYLRDEERRDAALEARAQQSVRKMLRG